MSIKIESTRPIHGEIVYTNENGKIHEYLRISTGEWQMRCGAGWTPINEVYTEVLETRYKAYSRQPPI